MRLVRIFEGTSPLLVNSEFTLNEDGSIHLLRVLRMGINDTFSVFDGLGNEYEAVILQSGKKALCKTLNKIERNTTSPLYIELAQVISRGDKMDFTLQKATELGVNAIYPLTSTRCSVKLDAKRMEKKEQSWQKIVISACEQCYRADVPKVHNTNNLLSFVEDDSEIIKVTLDPYATTKLKDLNLEKKKVRLLIGPEGGFDDSEVQKAKEHGYIGVSLGPRILRTETAALVAISILGSHFGDL